MKYSENDIFQILKFLLFLISFENSWCKPR